MMDNIYVCMYVRVHTKIFTIAASVNPSWKAHVHVSLTEENKCDDSPNKQGMLNIRQLVQVHMPVDDYRLRQWPWKNSAEKKVIRRTVTRGT